jgi:hypothetical protein
MMNRGLSNKRIVEIIGQCSAFALDEIIKNSADRVIKEIEANSLGVMTDSDSARSLRATIEQFRPIIKPEQYSRLEQTEIYVVAKPFCNAVADPNGSIIIFDSLLAALVYRMEVSLLIARLKNHFDEVSTKTGMTAAEFPTLAFRAMSLSLHLMNRELSLPRLADHFDEQLRRDAFVAFAGGLIFILFHELGHMVLEHWAAKDGEPLQAVPTLACTEAMNQHKAQEFEADRFAFDALVPEARCMVIVNVWYVMGFFLDYELFFSGSKQTHPFTINRIANLNEVSGALADSAIARSVSNMFAQRLKLIQSRPRELHPEQHLLPPGRLARIEKEALFTALGEEAEGRIALEQLLSAYRAIS